MLQLRQLLRRLNQSLPRSRCCSQGLIRSDVPFPVPCCPADSAEAPGCWAAAWPARTQGGFGGEDGIALQRCSGVKCHRTPRVAQGGPHLEDADVNSEQGSSVEQRGHTEAWPSREAMICSPHSACVSTGRTHSQAARAAFVHLRAQTERKNHSSASRAW